MTNIEIVQSFNQDQIDFLIELYNNNRYSFDRVLTNLYKYRDGNTETIVRQIIADSRGPLDAIKMIIQRFDIGLDVGKVLYDQYK